MDIKPIKTKKEYEAALEKILTLLSAALNTPEGDLLDVLTSLVEVYKAKHSPVEVSDPIEAIKFRLEQKKLSRKDLETLLNVRRGRVSELLTKKRPLTLRMIRTLHDKLGIPAETLLKEYTLHKGRS